MNFQRIITIFALANILIFVASIISWFITAQQFGHFSIFNPFCTQVQCENMYETAVFRHRMALVIGLILGSGIGILITRKQNNTLTFILTTLAAIPLLANLYTFLFVAL